MIKHLVIWPTQATATLAQKIEVKSRLEALRGVVPQLLEIDVGIDEVNATMSLTSLFASMEDMAVYQEHPAHKAVGVLIKPIVAGRVACDYTC